VTFLNEIGVNSRWSRIRINSNLFQKLKDLMKNAKEDYNKVEAVFRSYIEEALSLQSKFEDIGDGMIFIYGTYSIALIKGRRDKNTLWLWRPSSEIASLRNYPIWRLIEKLAKVFDFLLLPYPLYIKGLPISQFCIYLCIDPLSNRNRPISEEELKSVLRKYDIDPERSIILHFCESEGKILYDLILEAYRRLRKKIPCQLIIIDSRFDRKVDGHTFDNLRDAASKNTDIHIIASPFLDEIELNAIMSSSSIVLFLVEDNIRGVEIIEAMWKGKPVIAKSGNGISFFVNHKVSGFVINSLGSLIDRLTELLTDSDLRNFMGYQGRQIVKRNFLITRQLKDFCLLPFILEKLGKDIIYL
jgi:trehalose synthase